MGCRLSMTLQGSSISLQEIGGIGMGPSLNCSGQPQSGKQSDDLVKMPAETPCRPHHVEWVYKQ